MRNTEKLSGGKRVRKKILFGTLVRSALLLATMVANADPPVFAPDYQNYWVVHNDEGIEIEDPDFKEQEWGWSVQASPWDNNKNTGLMTEVWYTDTDYMPSNYPDEIRPIRDEGWKQNTWLALDTSYDTEGSNYATIHVKIYAASNDYPEYLNWTVFGGAQQDAYFRIRAYDWDTEEELCDEIIDVFGASSIKDKLGNNVDQFKLEFDWHRS